MSKDDINPSDYTPGTIIHNHPDWKYHAAPGISSSQVKTYANKSPRHYQHQYLLHTIDYRETDAMLLGTLVHCLVLEGDQFERRYEKEIQLEDYPDALNKAGELKNYCKKLELPVSGTKQELIARIQEKEPDAPIWDSMLYRQRQSKKRIVNTGMWDKARYMRDGVFDNQDAASLFGVGESEVSVWGEDEDTGLLTKCRADWLRPDGICADLKTCACSAPDKFSKDCEKFGYDLQEVHYLHTLSTVCEGINTFCFAAVESEPPYLCQVYELDDKGRRLVRARYFKALADIADSLKQEYWPGYTDTLSTLSLPGYYLRKLERFA